ncbi:hypothetical protein JCM8115_001776 [Rhodotorula mucilaginosa]
MAAVVVVKAVVPGWLSHPRRVSFQDRTLLDREILAGKLADAFALRPGSFRLAYRDDDNDLIELGTAADLSECIDFFSYGGSSNASSSAVPSSAGAVAKTVTLRIEVIVEYEGPALSEAGTGTGTTISSAATDREGALARWKAEQDALAVQFSRLVSRPTAQRFPPEDERLTAAEERNRDRRVWTIEQEALTLQAARAGLAGGRDQDHAAYTRRRDSSNDASSMGDWVRERAYDVAHGLDGGSSNTDTLSVSDAGLGHDNNAAAFTEDDDDDDWDRETVSSFVPFGGASRLPPGVPNGTGDSVGADVLGPRDDEALHPNFASHFVLAEPAEPFWPAPATEGMNGSIGLSQQHQRPIPVYQQQQQQQQWDSSPMFSSPGSSMYSVGTGRGVDSAYKPTGSERARVEALFAPSEYGSSSAFSAGGGGGGERDGPEMSAAADHHVAAVTPTRVPGDATPQSSQARTPLQPTARNDKQQATPPAGRAPSTLPTASATVVNSENDSGDFTCAVCMDAIDGVRYLCIQCDGYNLCETCETDPNAKLASRRRKQNSSTLGSAFSTLGGRTRRENEYIPMLHDSNHVLLKIKPGATLPGGFGRLGSVGGGGASGSSSSSSTPPAPIAPPAPPLSRPTTPLPYIGRAREIPVRLPADGPTRLTRPEPLGHASSAGGGASASESSSSSTGPSRSQLVPPIRIPAVNIPGFSVLGANVAPVRIPAINIPPVDFPTIGRPTVSTTPTASTPAAAPVPPRVMPVAIEPASFRRFDNVVERNHGVGCSHCGKLIPTGPGEEGVRWLCGNCPTVPGYNLCSDCELESPSIHDPSHAFLRLTHRLRRPLPSLNSGLVPLLYLPKQDDHDGQAEGQKNGVVASRDQAGRTTQGAKHAMIVCDACGQKITDAWMLCCHCPVSFDLCRPCLVERDASTLARHNPSHVFLGLKEPVDLELLKLVTRFSSRRPRGLLEWDLYS